jgi:8-amino-7-oxononanoate synthase
MRAFFLPCSCVLSAMSGYGLEQRLAASLQALRAAQQLRTRSTFARVNAVECLVSGRRCLSFASNDYLGLSFHSAVLEAFQKTAGEQAGAGASPLVIGRSPQQQTLEAHLAAWERADSVTVFPTGFAANIGTLTAIAGKRDVIFCDRENHASLIDGCRSTGARFCVYDRSDPEQLHESLRRRRGDFELALIVTDGVYSMDGTVADLSALSEIARDCSAVLVADEAHGSGVFGENGRGVCELQGMEAQVPIRIGTLSKAFGCLGGFVAGSAELGEWLWNTGRSQFFSTALPPAVLAAADAALGVIRCEPERRERVQSRSRFLRERLYERGVSVLCHPGGASGCRLSPPGSPIIAVPFGDSGQVLEASRRLFASGLVIPAIRPPTVPADQPRLRISVSSEHSEEDLVRAANAMAEVVARCS